MKVRKLVLIAADVLLLAVCIIQGISSSKNSVKSFEFKEEPDEIILEKADGGFTISKEGDSWFIGDKKYLANVGNIDSMITSIKSIRAIDKMGKISDDVIASRYDLTDEKCIKVTVNAGGKTLRKVTIGKESSTGTQCYVTIDGGNEIYLIADNLIYDFNKSLDDLRSKTVYQIEQNSISSISCNDIYQNVWTLSSTGSGEDFAWSISGANVDVDSTKANDWVKSFATLVTTKWYDENASLEGEKQNTFKIVTGTKTITIETYKVLATSDEEKDVYYAKCSESPYFFEIPSYSVQKFQKTPYDIAK